MATITTGADPSDSAQPGPASFAVRRDNFDQRTCVLAVEGELDIASTPHFKRVLMEPLGAGYTRLVLDLSDVTFIDSTALGVLVEINYERRLVSGTGLVMAGLRPSVLKVLEVTGLVGTFDISDTVESALSSSGGRAD